MMNAFPQGSSDPDVFTASVERAVTGLSSEAVCQAAQRFTAGLVEGQHKTFAPSVAEFATEARKQQDVVDIRSRPRLKAPEYIPGPLAPFQIARNKALAENANRPVIKENVGHAEFVAMSRSKDLPTGSVWVACLATVYGPEPASVTKAA